MEMKNFNKEFVERTLKIVQTCCTDEFEYDVTLLLNCLSGLVCLPTERTRQGESSFQAACVQKLKEMNVIETSTDDAKTFRTVRNAVSHMRIEANNCNGKINTLVLSDKRNGNVPVHTKLKFTVKELKEFALFVANEHLKRYEKRKR